MTASHTLADADGLGTISYQWKAGGVAITGATGSTYILKQTEVGKVITVTASYIDLLGAAESKTSAATTAVVNVNDLPTGSVTISGTATQGLTLTASHSLADVDGLGTVTYTWYASGSTTPLGTGSSYTLTQAQVGKTITAKATYTDLQGTVESKTSLASQAILNGLIIGTTGSDTLMGTYGADNLEGGLGNDLYYINQASDVVSEVTGSGTDTVYNYLTHTSAQTYTLGANVENGRIVTTAASNITGNSLNNILYAGAGNNILNGSTGTDTVSYQYGLVSGATLGVTVSLAIATAQSTGRSSSDTLSNIENLTGSSLNDTLIGSAGNNVLDGGLGTDSLVGGLGNDTYFINTSADIIVENANEGTDTVNVLFSGYTLGANIENGRIVSTTASNMSGNLLSNTIYAGAGNNLISGGTGTEIDTVSYQYGLISGATSGINANLATGSVTGTSGTDTLTRIENLIGSSLNDTLTGSAGNNILNGGSGNDSLSGGDGIDTLIGGADKDTLVGGNGNDIFDFNALTEMGITSTTWDVISDFISTQDRVDLSTLDANTATTTNDAFSATLLSGTAAFTMAGQLRFDATTKVLYGNTDADTTAEFAIQLTGVTALSSADLVL